MWCWCSDTRGLLPPDQTARPSGKNPALDDTNSTVTLSTTASSAPSSTGDRALTHAADLGALVCALSAGVHGALVAPHADVSPRIAVGFALTTVAVAIGAVALAVRPAPKTTAAVAALLFLVAGAYLLSRASGIPGLVDHREPFDPLGSSVSLLEVAAATLLWGHLISRRNQ